MEDHKPKKKIVIPPSERETKSSRMQIYVYPSLRKKLEEAKKTQDLSFNEIIGHILEENIDDYI